VSTAANASGKSIKLLDITRGSNLVADKKHVEKTWALIGSFLDKAELLQISSSTCALSFEGIPSFWEVSHLNLSQEHQFVSHGFKSL